MAAKTERLLNLVVALLHARRPQTFGELRQRMGEWQDGDPESMRRKFERDKDELRRLGVPVETVALDALGGELAYTIDAARYEQPDVALDVDEVTVLAVALQLVDGGAQRLAWAKLAARAPDPRGGDVPSGVRVTVDTAAAVPLAEAVVGRRRVRFSYRTAAGELATRTVDPAAVVARRGATYLVGRDHDRDALRAFRLDRVEGEVEVLADHAGPVPDDLDLDALTAGPPTAPILARVEEHGPDGATRQVQRRGAPRALCDAVLRASPDLVVLDPPGLRDAVVAALQAVADAHEVAR